MSRRAPRSTYRGPKGPRLESAVLEYVRGGFKYLITVRSDGSWKAMLGTKLIARGEPYAGEDAAALMATNALMVDAERLAHEAIERNPMG